MSGGDTAAARRFNTTLEAAGAEHLVIGRLLTERIQAFRAYANQPGYDLIGVDPVSRRSIRVQVKSCVALWHDGRVARVPLSGSSSSRTGGIS